MSNSPSVFAGALRYEFRMQVRRRAVWITMLLLVLFAAGLDGRLVVQGPVREIVTHLNRFPLPAVLAYWTRVVSNIVPIGVGCLLADRLPRDRSLRVEQLLTTLPGALSARLLGKYLGGIVAVLLPALIFYFAGVLYILIQTHDPLTLPLALVTFAAIILPGVVFVSAFSLACTAVLWVPLYIFLFIGYWFWGTALPPGAGIPTLNGTILTPTGDYMVQGFFGGNVPGLHATPTSAVESLLVLVGCALFALLALYGWLTWQRARQ